MSSLKKIEGIGPKYFKQLKNAGVKNQKDLLKKGSTPTGRKKLSEDSKLPSAKILDFVNRADLARVKGVGEEYSDLLENCGVDTVKELAQRNPENLHAIVIHLNEKRKYTRRTPSEKQIKKWVSHAKKLKRAVNY